METTHFVLNLVRLSKQIYDLCLPFDIARLYVRVFFCNHDLPWIKMTELDVCKNVGFDENLRQLYLIMWLMSVVGTYVYAC
jgi:hypothetical protein